MKTKKEPPMPFSINGVNFVKSNIYILYRLIQYKLEFCLTSLLANLNKSSSSHKTYTVSTNNSVFNSYVDEITTVNNSNASASSSKSYFIHIYIKNFL